MPKTRTTLAWQGAGIHRTYSGGIETGSSPAGPFLGLSTATIAGSGNPGWRKLGKTTADIGGSVVIDKVDWTIPGGEQVRLAGNLDSFGRPRITYEGMFFAAEHTHTSGLPTGVSWPSFFTESNMIALGTKGVANSLPTNPLSGLNQFIGELRQLPKRFNFASWKSQASALRGLERGWKKNLRKGRFIEAADDYLNLQFGWLPLISDIKSFADSTANYKKYADRLVKGSGKHIRRRRKVYDESVTNPVAEDQYHQPSLDIRYFRSPIYYPRYKSVTTRTVAHFSGAFTYYLPPANKRMNVIGQSSRDRRIRKIIYGAGIDAELLYNLAPWSWAVDWVTSTGDVIHNWNAFQNDGLVMHYGYLTAKYTRTYSWVVRPDFIRKLEGPNTFTQALELKRTHRIRASPYGFGILPGALNARQWSIIGALGISKGFRQL